MQVLFLLLFFHSPVAAYDVALVCLQHRENLRKGLQEVLKGPTATPRKVAQQTFLMLVSWKPRLCLSALLVITAGNSKLSSSMSDANLPFIIARLRKVPGRGFQDVNAAPSAARPAVAPAPSAASYPDHAPENLCSWRALRLGGRA